LLKKYSDLLLVLVALSWGSTFILVKKAIMDLPAFSFLFVRFFLAFLLMYILFYKKITLNKNTLKAAFILGAFNFIAYALQTISLYYLPSNIVAILTGLFVIFTPIIAFFIFEKSISIYAAIGALMAFVGIYFLNIRDNFIFSPAIILVILCAFFYALHINFTDIFSKKYNIYTLVTFQFLAVALFSLIFIPFEDLSNVKISGVVVLAIVITVIFATVFAFFIQTFAQQYTSATKTAIIFALEPLSATIIGVFFGESLNLKQIIGAILVILSMIITEIGDEITKRGRDFLKWLRNNNINS